MDASELNGNPTPQRRQTFAGWTEHGHRLPDPFRLEVQMRIDHEESLRVLRLERQGPQIIRPGRTPIQGDRKSTRLNSSHQIISYAVFCLKKKKKNNHIVTLHIKYEVATQERE